ncbi:MAG TPA: L,D-transpeptidase [Rhizomicrobium sp.]|nr:L,D-transpeptidase [Rhizomicrobium sp.]
MSLLRLLALSYLVSASVFVMAAIVMAHPQLSRDMARGTNALMEIASEEVIPLFQKRPETFAVARLDLDLSAPVRKPREVHTPDIRTWAHADMVPPTPRTIEAPEQKADAASAALPDGITILPDLPPLPTRAVKSEPHPAPAFHVPDPPAPDAPPPNRGQLVAAHLEAGLTPEMFRNFDLFLYVSKADTGPLSQRLYVFKKQRSGDLKLLYDWPASTGREQRETSPRGRRTVTATPAGYYELDPKRMYRSYRSYNWDQDMPHAMFFNWEREGLQTGLAIHAAVGRDIEKLGSRASAGCVHLSPENAEALFNLIHESYRGPVPRFAYDRDTRTMSNQGRFMHDRAGNLKMADGYRVLIRIENYGGGDVVAALF